MLAVTRATLARTHNGKLRRCQTRCTLAATSIRPPYTWVIRFSLGLALHCGPRHSAPIDPPPKTNCAGSAIILIHTAKNTEIHGAPAGAGCFLSVNSVPSATFQVRLCNCSAAVYRIQSIAGGDLLNRAFHLRCTVMAISRFNSVSRNTVLQFVAARSRSLWPVQVRRQIR